MNLAELFQSLALLNQSSEQWWSGFRRTVAIGAAVLMWLVLVLWYFFGQRTREFFAARSLNDKAAS
jgi:hypothetical protein